jgi:hypothetical protein
MIMTRRGRSKQHLLCISNRGYRASLMTRRIYRTLPDPEGARRGLVRVIDESGEDFLFPAKLFVTIELPKEAGAAFSKAS